MNQFQLWYCNYVTPNAAVQFRRVPSATLLAVYHSHVAGNRLPSRDRLHFPVPVSRKSGHRRKSAVQ